MDEPWPLPLFFSFPSADRLVSCRGWRLRARL